MPSLDRRKVQVAGNSLSVTLPKGWCRFFGMKAEDQVEIIGNGDRFTRRPGSAKPPVVEPQDGRQAPT